MEIPLYIATKFQDPEPQREITPASTGGPIAAGMGKLADALQEVDLEVAKKVGDAERLGELVSRKGKFREQIGQLDDSLSQDPDHRTYFDRAKKGIEQATTEAIAGVNDPELKNALVSHVYDARDRYLLDARHKARALTIDFTSGALETSIDQRIKSATSTGDATELMRELGGISADVAGGVAGGVFGAKQGEQILREARQKIYTTLALQMADQEPGRFLVNYKEGVYKDTVDPIRLEEIRRYAENRSGAVDAIAASTAVWEEFGPKRDEDPINEDLMARALEARFAEEPEKAKLAIASLREKTYAHDKGSKERKDANLSAVWKASLAGRGIAQIVASPEYAALDGDTQRQVKEHLEDRSWTLRGRAQADPGRKAAQHELYWRYSQPAVLARLTEGNITALYPSLGVELTDKLVENRRALDNPAKSAEAKIDADDFNHFARTVGISPEKKDNKAVLGEIKYQVENAIDAEQRSKGKPLTREEKAKVMKRGLVEVDVETRASFFGVDLGRATAKKRVFDIQYPGNILIPPADRKVIEEGLSERGLPVTDDNVRTLYLRLKEK